MSASTTTTQIKTITVAQAITEALDECLSADPRVFLIGEDLADPGGGVSGATKGLSTKHGANRVLDTPISEAAIIGAAVGAAFEGQIPVAEIMIMDFITIAMDQLVNIAAKARFMSANLVSCPLTVRTATFGGLGTGATHSQSLEGWFMHVPGLKVIVPSTPADVKGLLKAAIFDPDPCLFIETVACYGVRGEVPLSDHVVPIGVADIKRPGKDVTVITYGRAVFDSLQAAETLAAEGIDVEVVDLRSLVPLDTEAIFGSVRRSGRAVVTHYATEFAGPGAEVTALISSHLFDVLKAPVQRVASRYRPISAAKSLEAEIYPSADKIVSSVRSVMEYSR